MATSTTVPDLKGPKGSTILVVGKTGSGMSTLINRLLGVDRFKTGWSATSISNDVEEVSSRRDNFDLKVYATPGLANPDKNPRKTFEIIEQRTGGKIDVLIYCRKMEERVSSSDGTAIGHIADFLRSPSVRNGCSWENVVYVLTFANTFKTLIQEQEQEQPGVRVFEKDTLPVVEQKFYAHLDALTLEILKRTQDIIQDRHELPTIDAARIAVNIPVVPAGNQEKAICGCDDWLGALWSKILLKMTEAAAPTLSVIACQVTGRVSGSQERGRQTGHSVSVMQDNTGVSVSGQQAEGSMDNLLQMSDLAEITGYLSPLTSKADIHVLGLCLGLPFQRLKYFEQNSITYLDDVMAAWVHGEGEVDERGGTRWSTLVKTLQHDRLRQTRIAKKIAEEKGLLAMIN